MACLLGCFSLVFPRLMLLAVALFTNYLEHAYHSFIWPILGFLFMPLTTLAYAWAYNTNHSVEGIYLVVVVLAVLLDLGVLGSGSWHGRYYRVRRVVP